MSLRDDYNRARSHLTMMPPKERNQVMSEAQNAAVDEAFGETVEGLSKEFEGMGRATALQVLFALALALDENGVTDGH